MGFITKFENKIQKGSKEALKGILDWKINKHLWLSKFILKLIKKISKTIKIKGKTEIPKR